MNLKIKRKIPNFLSVLRLFAVPLLLYLLLIKFYFAAAIVFTLAAATDSLDGLLARRWKVESNLGALLDPIADKAMVFVGFLVLAVLGELPVWIVMVVLLRDLLIVTVYMLYPTSRRSTRFRASVLSKINMAAQAFLLFFMFWRLGLGFEWPQVQNLAIWTVLCTTFASAFGYLGAWLLGTAPKIGDE